jgi:Ca-activated chloride channel family protein
VQQHAEILSAAIAIRTEQMPPLPGALHMTVDFHITPRKDALLEGYDNSLEVLVRAVGPTAPEWMSARNKLNLAIVIDRSGSMQGQPLEEAKRCAKAIVRQLTNADYVAVVAYCSTVSVVCNARQVDDAERICALIDRIETSGMTALYDGWAEGAMQAARHLNEVDVSRVLLLSDGNANAGLTDQDKIAHHCAHHAALGVSTSTYGLGENFNEGLMFAMAKAGGGNAYFGKTAADLMTPLQQEFDLLQALCARKLMLKLEAGHGITVKMANDLVGTESGWHLPDLAFASEAWALVSLHVPRNVAALALGTKIELLRATLSYTTDSDEVHTVTVPLVLEALPQAAYTAIADHELVARRAQEVRFAAFQREAGDAAEAGDWGRVEDVLNHARKEAAGNEWLLASLTALESHARERKRSLFAKEARFKSSRMTRRLSSPNEMIEFSALSETFQPSYLRRRSEEGEG